MSRRELFSAAVDMLSYMGLMLIGIVFALVIGAMTFIATYSVLSHFVGQP